MKKTNTDTMQTATPNTFETVKRTFEQAYTEQADYTEPLYTLATAIAYSVLNKCIDPQRKAAADRETVSDNGHNPALITLRRGIGQDRRLLEGTQYTAERATRTTFNYDGDYITTIADKDANNALTVLIDETLSDGIDLVHTAAAAILEQAAEHANGENWLDSKHTVRRLSKRVYIRLDDSAAYRVDETTPIQEVYRTVRRAIQDSRATQTDPRNGYSYIEDLTADGLETIYHRLQKYTDLGGANIDGLYTTDKQSAIDFETMIERLQLTDRQAQVIRLRMQGKGYKAIATYLGVTQRAIAKTVEQVQKKAIASGFIPAGTKAAQG